MEKSNPEVGFEIGVVIYTPQYLTKNYTKQNKFIY